MSNHRINNYRMAGYAALAVGLINLRYQTGSDSNLPKSMALVIPGLLLLLLTFMEAGKKVLMGRTAALAVTVVGALLLIYSFVV